MTRLLNHIFLVTRGIDTTVRRNHVCSDVYNPCKNFTFVCGRMIMIDRNVRCVQINLSNVYCLHLAAYANEANDYAIYVSSGYC